MCAPSAGGRVVAQLTGSWARETMSFGDWQCVAMPETTCADRTDVRFRELDSPSLRTKNDFTLGNRCGE